ncbi:MAG: hypothetical protein DDT32_01045 [Syntrophomonadaceae bacterium]|nr:hypothetical protein [Bacillota bacterium]
MEDQWDKWHVQITPIHQIRRKAGGLNLRNASIGDAELEVLLPLLRALPNPSILLLDFTSLSTEDEIMTSELPRLGPMLLRHVLQHGGKYCVYHFHSSEVMSAFDNALKSGSTGSLSVSAPGILSQKGVVIGEVPQYLVPTLRCLLEYEAPISSRELTALVEQESLVGEARKAGTKLISAYLGKLHDLRLILREKRGRQPHGYEYLYLSPQALVLNRLGRPELRVDKN